MWSPEFCSGDTKIIGPAFTVKFVHKEDTSSPTPDQHFVDAATEGSVMVISVPPDVKNACWGGLMSARAMAKNVQGVIIDGRIRDLSEQRQLKFPLFAKSHSILPQNAFTRPSALQVPISFEHAPDVIIHPGDIMVADLDGVVCIPQHLVDQVVQSCEKYTAIDEKCMQDLLNGHTIQETFKKHRG
ncbi:unnamed protein product [Cunninghamella echinulata]